MNAKTNEIRINYELSGKPNAPVVVLSHSLACSMVMWTPQLELLEDNFRVLRIDTRGHGGSDAPDGPYSFEQLVGDMVAVLDGLDIDSVHWIGLSMGGMIGQTLTLAFPDRVLSLVLADTAAIVPDQAQGIWQDRIDAVRNGGMQAIVEATLQRWFTAGFRARNPAAIDQIRHQILATPSAGYIGCSEAIRRLDLLDKLPAIKVPTLIIVGANDPGTPVAASEAMHARMRMSQLVVIPSAAHLSNIEQPEIFNSNLMRHLSRRDID